MKQSHIYAISILAIACIPILHLTANSPNKGYSIETGPAKFLRDHDQAMTKAKQTGKPVFAFFQEVPG